MKAALPSHTEADRKIAIRKGYNCWPMKKGDFMIRYEGRSTPYRAATRRSAWDLFFADHS